MFIEFGYDKKKVIQALRYHFLNRPELKVMVILINVFAFISAIFFYMKMIQPVSFLVFSLLWFAIMVVIWRVLPATIYRRSPTFKDVFKLNFYDQQLILSNAKGEKVWYWNQIAHYMESPEFFYLYFDPKSFFLIPKEAMEGEVSSIEVRKYISDRVKKG